MKQKKKSIWLVPVAMTMITLFLLKSVFLIGYVPTASMEPTIKQGSFVVGLRFYGELEGEDIIIFRHDGKLLVKRIAAAGGESVRWREGTLCVPEGAYCVLGDNADIQTIRVFGRTRLCPKSLLRARSFLLSACSTSYNFRFVELRLIV